jgi:hypothetical protein
MNGPAVESWIWWVWMHRQCGIHLRVTASWMPLPATSSAIDLIGGLPAPGAANV